MNFRFGHVTVLQTVAVRKLTGNLPWWYYWSCRALLRYSDALQVVAN